MRLRTTPGWPRPDDHSVTATCSDRAVHSARTAVMYQDNQVGVPSPARGIGGRARVAAMSSTVAAVAAVRSHPETSLKAVANRCRQYGKATNAATRALRLSSTAPPPEWGSSPPTVVTAASRTKLAAAHVAGASRRCRARAKDV